MGNQAAAQAAHACLYASAGAEVDFLDEGWPVDGLTGAVLTLDLALAESVFEPLLEPSSSLDSLASDDLVAEVRLWNSSEICHGNGVQCCCCICCPFQHFY